MRILKTEEEKRLKKLERIRRKNRVFLKPKGEPNLTVKNCTLLYRTLQEAATEMGVTRQCVQQTERRALVKVRCLLQIPELDLLKINLKSLESELKRLHRVNNRKQVNHCDAQHA